MLLWKSTIHGGRFTSDVKMGSCGCCSKTCDYTISFAPLIEIGKYTGNFTDVGYGIQVPEIEFYISQYSEIVNIYTNFHGNSYCPIAFDFFQFINSTSSKYNFQCDKNTNKKDLYYDFCKCNEQSPFIKNLSIYVNGDEAVNDDLFYIYRNNSTYKKCQYNRTYSSFYLPGTQAPSPVYMLDPDGKSITEYIVSINSVTGTPLIGAYVKDCYFLTNFFRIDETGKHLIPLNERKLFAVKQFVSDLKLKKIDTIDSLKADIDICSNDGYISGGNSITNYNPCKDHINFNNVFPNSLTIEFSKEDPFDFNLKNILNIQEHDNQMPIKNRKEFIYPIFFSVKKTFEDVPDVALTGKLIHTISTEVTYEGPFGNLDVSGLPETIDKILSIFSKQGSDDGKLSRGCFNQKFLQFDYNDIINPILVEIPAPKLTGWTILVPIPDPPYEKWISPPTSSYVVSSSKIKLFSGGQKVQTSINTKAPDSYISPIKKTDYWPFMDSENCTFDNSCHELYSSKNMNLLFYNVFSPGGGSWLDGASHWPTITPPSTAYYSDFYVSIAGGELIEEQNDCSGAIKTRLYTFTISIGFAPRNGFESWKNPRGEFDTPLGGYSKTGIIRVRQILL